jgi:hypothetical protein
MQKHLEVYSNYFGIAPTEYSPCEIPFCGLRAVDVHHIDAKGMGGTTHDYHINELMGLCRSHHEGEWILGKELMKYLHLQFIYCFIKNKNQ